MTEFREIAIRNVVVDVLCTLKAQGDRASVVPVLKTLGLTLSQARYVLSTSNPRVGTIEYALKVDALTILCFAELDLFKTPGVIGTIQTPPRTGR
jgi:hypothetical protein